MKKILSFFFFCLVISNVFSHDIDYGKIVLRHWKIENGNFTVDASFSFLKNNEVFLEDINNNIIHFPLNDLSIADQKFVNNKYAIITQLNNDFLQIKSTASRKIQFGFYFLMLMVFGFGFYLLRVAKFEKRKYLTPVFLVGFMMILYGFTDKKIKSLLTTTDPLFMDSAFAPFKPKIYTHWDNTYFYVESKGIADHEMMTGITAWQQQVPIPQCYTTANNNNAWSIPLNPVISSSPIPVDQIHFIRGALALAVNGIPIFNYHTNTGVDSYLDGQLDIYGGHCGRADDYHYHIAPLVLYNQIAANKPVAFALDGFAIYGAQEPEGTPMTTLDANHGHYAINGVYHYHGTPPSQGAPYMIGNMVGVVTEDANYQIIPQATAKGVRTALTPLTGAAITGCTPNGTNTGYNLTYTKSNLTYHVNYNWVDSTSSLSKYIFHFISPTTTVDSIYTGFSQTACLVPTGSTTVTTTGMSKTMKRLPDTGEQLSYTNTFGEDNDYTINPPYYVNNGNGTITDTVTGLMWQKTDGGEMTYENAVIYCDTLSLAGYTDWRLPNPHEAFSILNQQFANPAIDTTKFTKTSADYWWASYFQKGSTTNVWCTNAGGGVGNKPKSETISAGGTFRYCPRAVRNAFAPSTVAYHFIDNGDGTIKDNLTNLVWQKVPLNDTLTWENALIYAEGFSLAGYSDWRLPNIKEIESISDELLANPSIDTSFFKIINNKKYWSSTTLPNQTSKAWYLNSRYGITTYDNKTARDYVLCVRGTSYLTNSFIFTGTGNWGEATNWSGGLMPPAILPAGYSIYVDPVTNGQCILNTTQTISQGATIIVNPNKKFIIPGGLIQQ